MNVFVDPSVFIHDYLQGYGGRLKVLKAFENLLAKGKFKLIFPTVSRDELYKGIPADHIRYSKNEFAKLSIPAVPAGVEQGENYKAAKKLLDQYSGKIEEVRKEAEVAVDDLMKNHIEKLIGKAENIIEDQQIIFSAQARKMKQNPPGKSSDSLGDQIVWELLLQKCNDDDLSIVTLDEDWTHEKWNKGRLHPLLTKEWKERSGKSIQLFFSMASFVESIDPNAVTKDDVKSEESSIPPLLYFQQPSDFLLVRPNSGSLHPSISTRIDSMGSMIPGLLSSPPVEKWQPVNLVGTVNNQVVCMSCNLTFPVQDCYVTMRGYYCKNCYKQ